MTGFRSCSNNVFRVEKKVEGERWEQEKKTEQSSLKAEAAGG